MRVTKGAKITLAVLGLVLLALGGYSVYRYGEAAPALNNKQSGNLATETLAEGVRSANLPSVVQLQAVNVPASSIQNTPAEHTSINPQTAAGTTQPDSVSPQSTESAVSQPSDTNTLQGTLDGLTGSLGLNLNL